MNKKRSISVFEFVWYILCCAVILWGITYVALSLIDKYNDLSDLHNFAVKFKATFGLALYFWGLIIMAIGAVAMVVVMIIYAKTFDRAADREQRRSARLNAIKKETIAVAEEKPEVVAEQPAPVEEPQPEETPVEEPKVEEEPQPEEASAEEPVEQPAEEAKEEPLPEDKE